ncbi:MAG: hypothetical protein IH986_15185 [Planctomycetes bacterium]|nr:hypothetical protein [Planctomycetota bacterium]
MRDNVDGGFDFARVYCCGPPPRDTESFAILHDGWKMIQSQADLSPEQLERLRSLRYID